MSALVVYPGSFDPITNGHLSLIRRGLSIFDQIIVAVAVNPSKKSLFTVEERVDMIREVLKGEERIEVDSFQGLTVDYTRKRKANAILRGIRAMSDFENEFQLALMNRRLNRDIQSVFLMTDYKWFYMSSSLIKEVASLGGDIKGMVPKIVAERLIDKFNKLKA
jgi:pantetheine-phosphate adenylyltransferase